LQDKASDYLGPASSNVSINDQFIINSLDALERYESHSTQGGTEAMIEKLGNCETEYYR